MRRKKNQLRNINNKNKCKKFDNKNNNRINKAYRNDN